MHADDMLQLKYVTCDAELLVMRQTNVHHHECALHLLGYSDLQPSMSAVGNERP